MSLWTDTNYNVTINTSDSTFGFATSCDPADTGVVTQTFTNQFGCDSVHTVTTTLDLVSSSNQDIPACDSAVINGTTYYASTAFSDTIPGGSVNGCDSVVNYNVTINASNLTFGFATSCDPADTGVVAQTFTNQFGCDSVHTIATTLLPSDSTFGFATSCDPADTGVVSQTFANQYGCDSVHTVTTTLDLESSSNQDITACDSAVINGTTYHASTAFSDTIPAGSVNGCDSVINYNVTINISDSTFGFATSCDPADTGVVSQTFTNQFGCDSVHTIATTFLPSDSTFGFATSCDPADTGVVSQTFTNQYGCDSVYTVTTTLDLVSSSNQDITACDSAVINGTNYYTSTVFSYTIPGGSVNGCDSVVNYNVTINASNSTFGFATSCDPADTGVVSQTFTNQYGCDSVHTVTTTLDLVSSSNQSVTDCDSTTINGTTYYASTTFSDTIQGGSVNGCDSVINYTVTVNPSSTTSESRTSCDPADVGVVVQTFPNRFGCDSTHTITTTLSLVSSSNQNISGCDSATVNGTTYYASTVFSDTIPGGSVNGCDSVVNYMVTVNPSSTTSESRTSCDPADVGVVVQTFPNRFGCDSTHTITTTLSLVSSSNQNIMGCDSVTVNGTTYYASTTFSDTIPGGSVNGCDSVVNYNITVNPSSATSENRTSCDPADVGVVVQTFQNQYGCDSVRTITTTLALVSISNQNVIACDSVTVNGTTYHSSTTFRDTIPGGSVNGCDSVINYTVTVNPGSATSESRTSCNPLDTGVVAQNHINQHGCDSTHTIITILIICDDSDACTKDSCASGQCEFTTIVCDDGDACTLDECTPIACTPLWQDGFESYSTGGFPPTWVADGNGTSTASNYVDGTVAHFGSNSLRLFGVIGGCWEALAYRPIPVAPPFEIELQVRSGNEFPFGCHQSRGGVGLRQGTSWTNPGRGFINFTTNEIISGGGTLLASYASFTWYAIRICYERPSPTSVKVSYWVDGVYKGFDLLAAIPAEDQLTNLQLSSGDGTAWFDDVRINSCTDGCNATAGCSSFPVDCNDNNACTDDGCDSITGCFNVWIPCDDGNACTTDTCLSATGGCDYATINCDDNNTCTTDTCINGACQNNLINCDDGNACTIDYCVNGSCIFTPIACDDSDACTSDTCLGGQCSFNAIDCNDSNACTNDSCVNGSCVFTPIICDDSNSCTEDSCAGGQCQFTSIICDDANPCTRDSCVSGSCVFTAVICDDSNPCTEDSCVGGQCQSTAIICDDGDVCNGTETCDLILGCQDGTPVSIEVTIVHIPPVDTINRGGSITLSASSNPGGLSYSWYPSQGLSCDSCLNPVATPDTTTAYLLTATDANGCFDTAGTLIIMRNDTLKPNDCPDYIYVPNAFSPNRDGVNDMFYVYGNARGILDMHLRIFNRWGEFIFESFSLNDGWDGTYKGKLQDPGVFVYYLSVTFCDGSTLSENSEYRKGSVTLIR